MRQKALLRFSGEERFDWHYVPRSRGGLPLGDLNPDQTSLLHAFLRANLGWRLLRDEEHHARAFLQSLDTAQRARAVISPVRRPTSSQERTDSEASGLRFSVLGRILLILRGMCRVHVRKAKKEACPPIDDHSLAGESSGSGGSTASGGGRR